MRRPRPTLAIAAVALLGAMAATPHDDASPSDALGCSSRPAGTSTDLPAFGVAVDGEILHLYDRGDVPNLGELTGMPDPSAIKRIEIVCWAAVERMYDVRVRSGISAIWTYDPFADSEAFLREAFARAVAGEDVGQLRPPHPELTVSREALEGEGAFHVELRHPKQRRVCWISSESVPARPGASTSIARSGSEAGVPYCTSLHDHGGSGA